MPVFVLDSSVIAQWIKSAGELGVSQARDYLQKYRDGKIRIAVPELLFYEIINISRLDRSLPVSTWVEGITTLFGLELEVRRIDSSLGLRIRSVSEEYGVSAYDGTYLVLAQELGTVVVTQDKELLVKAPGLTKPL